MNLIIEILSTRFERKGVWWDIDFTFSEGTIYGLPGHARNSSGLYVSGL